VACPTCATGGITIAARRGGPERRGAVANGDPTAVEGPAVATPLAVASVMLPAATRISFFWAHSVTPTGGCPVGSAAVGPISDAGDGAGGSDACGASVGTTDGGGDIWADRDDATAAAAAMEEAGAADAEGDGLVGG